MTGAKATKARDAARPTPAAAPARSSAVALSPPSYGIDLADQQAPERAREERYVLRRACACAGGASAGGCGCDDKGQVLFRRASEAGGPDRAPAVVHDVLRSGGQPLPAGVRGFFEPRFGRDLSGVRVHNDGLAAESARAVNALAYTVGQHVVFGAGTYAPESQSGQRLLAHELAHTVQQGGGGTIQRTADLVVGSATDPLEQAADRMADSILAGTAPEPAAVTTAAVQTTPLVQRASSAGCPPHPTGLGDHPPPEACETSVGPTSGDLFEYCVDTAMLKHAEVPRFTSPAFVERLRAGLLRAGNTIDVHAFASEEGPKGRADVYNMTLSCHRAHDAKLRLVALGLPGDRIRLFSHGSTGGHGSRDRDRSIVIGTSERKQENQRRTFRVAAVSYLSCATCNPFSDDGLSGPNPPLIEPPSHPVSFRQKHLVEVSFETADGWSIAPGTISLTGDFVGGKTGYCNQHLPAQVLVANRSTPSRVTSNGVEGVEIESHMTGRVQANIPPTLPGAPCGLIGNNPRIPFIGNRFRMRLFADGRKESEFHEATLFPFHYLYEDFDIKTHDGAPVRPRLDFAGWSLSGAYSPPSLTIALDGLKAYILACHIPSVFSACPTECAGGITLPPATLVVPGMTVPQGIACAGVGLTVHNFPCPPAACHDTDGPSNPSPSGGI